MATGQYIRVYHELKDEYPGVWRSDAQLALFVRLLMIADKWWPQWAPVASRSGAYRSLVECGLVIENQGASGFTIKGLGQERSRRSQHGRHAASMRWASSEHAQSMPSKAEQSRAKQSNGQSPLTDAQRRQLLQENVDLMNDATKPADVRRAAEHTVALLRKGLPA